MDSARLEGEMQRELNAQEALARAERELQEVATSAIWWQPERPGERLTGHVAGRVDAREGKLGLAVRGRIISPDGIVIGEGVYNIGGAVVHIAQASVRDGARVTIFFDGRRPSGPGKSPSRQYRIFQGTSE